MYYYLLGSLTLFLLWLILFLWRKNLRREMIIASLLVTPVAFSEILFVPGYWLPKTLFNPKLSIEDFIFSFAVGGIIAILYEVFMGRKIERHQRLCACFDGKLVHGLILGIGIIVIVFTYFFFKINFMYAAILGMLTDILLIVLTRADLLKKILFSGLLFSLFYFLFFSIFSFFVPGFIKHWNLAALSGIIILGVPLEEIIWALTAGALLGPIYEYLLSIRILERR